MKSLIHLESLRGLAALLVFLSHFSQTNDLSKSSPFWNWIDRFGNVGVDIFFVLSGFVITYSLTRSHKSLAQFLKGRARRLVPIYFLLTLVAALLILGSQNLEVETGLPPLDYLHLMTSFLFGSQVSGFGLPVVAQGWTLEFEVAFYLLAAITLLRKGGFGRLHALSLAISLAVVGALIDIHFYEFALGVIGYLVFETLADRLGKFQNWVAILLLGIGSSVVVAFVPATMETRVQSWALGSLCIVLGCAFLGSRKLKGSVASYLGAISYPFYLFQWISIPLAARGFAFIGATSVVLTLVFCLSVTLLGSHLLNKHWDEPIKRKMASGGW